MRGSFIVLEGIDRSGKSTMAKRLEDHFLSLKQEVMIVHFPIRDSESGRKINDYLQSKTDIDTAYLHDLFCQNRWEFVNDLISALKNGCHVIADRYSHSGIAYSVARGMNISDCQKGDIGLPKPDLIVYLDIKPEAASKRSGYGEERTERIDFQKKVRDVYQRLMNDHWILLDAEKSTEMMFSELREFLPTNLGPIGKI